MIHFRHPGQPRPADINRNFYLLFFIKVIDLFCQLNTDFKSGKRKRIAGPNRNREDIKRIRSILSDKPRDLLLFDLAVHTGIGIKKTASVKGKASYRN
jgi:hypothetical protein